MLEINPSYVEVIINRYIKFKGKDDDVFLIDNNNKISWKEFSK